MNEQDDEVALVGNSSNPSQTSVFKRIWEFALDTLDAQRESAEAFIVSQRH